MPILDLVSASERRTPPEVVLSPVQRKAAEGVLYGLERGQFVVLQDQASDGKTTVLEHIHRELGGAWIGIRDFLGKLSTRDPIALEEAFLDLIDSVLE
ncbi:MAG: hypothetical protein DMG59_07940 [Acidobacteria bacterium]|nr:MAG: hypothetical protein DMG59_07940 [Acidobacteriota bacterium]